MGKAGARLCLPDAIGPTRAGLAPAVAASTAAATNAALARPISLAVLAILTPGGARLGAASQRIITNF